MAMNRVKEIERINARDLKLQLAADTVGDAGKWDVNKSWHAQYKDSAYVYVGGLPYDLSEGDIIVVFSQFGEIVDVNLPRDKETGKPKGFAFIAYEDQRSTVLAVDNFNGAKLLGRTLRCDHCASFHEEQKKDPAKLPDHVTRKLSDADLAKKQAEVEQRNNELEEAAAAKSELFALGRGTETEREHEERVLRRQIEEQRDAAANAKRAGYIETVLAKRRAESQRAVADEKRQEEEWLERKRKREADFQRQAQETADREAAHAVGMRPAGQRPAAASADPPVAAAAPAKWDRFLGGGGGKMKKPKLAFKAVGSSSSSAPPPGGDSGGGRGGGGEQRTGDGISVGETNALRASLGLKPLRE